MLKVETEPQFRVLRPLFDDIVKRLGQNLLKIGAIRYDELKRRNVAGETVARWRETPIQSDTPLESPTIPEVAVKVREQTPVPHLDFSGKGRGGITMQKNLDVLPQVNPHREQPNARMVAFRANAVEV